MEGRRHGVDRSNPAGRTAGLFLPHTHAGTQGLGLYLVVWAVIFPIQTLVVHSANPDDIEPLYFVLNAIILAGGIGLNTLGARLRLRLRRREATGQFTQ